jgi:hypothetical protein
VGSSLEAKTEQCVSGNIIDQLRHLSILKKALIGVVRMVTMELKTRGGIRSS